MSCPAAELNAARWTVDFRARSAQARRPISAALELTRRCNLRCAHCYLGDQAAQHRLRDRELGAETVKAALSEWTEAGCLYLLITGGEPLLRHDFAEIYRHARGLGLVVSVFSNGTLATGEIAELFRGLPPRKVEISLYGATAETHDAATGVPGSHARAWEGIRRLHGAGVRVGLKTLLMKTNLREFGAMENQAKELGVDFRHDAAIIPCLHGGSRAPLALRVSPEEAVRTDMADPGRRSTWRESIARAAARPENARLYGCSAGQTYFHCDPFGGLSPCMLAERFRRRPAGRAFQEVWNGDLAEIRGRKRTRDGGCFTGSLRGACAHCPAFNLAETGDEERESDYMKQTTLLRYRAAMGRNDGVLP